MIRGSLTCVYTVGHGKAVGKFKSTVKHKEIRILTSLLPHHLLITLKFLW